MSTTSETELRAEIAWLEARNREVNRQRIEAETVARSQAARLSELERENARMRGALSELAAATRDVQSQGRDPKQKQRLVSRLDAAVFAAEAALAGSGEP